MVFYVQCVSYDNEKTVFDKQIYLGFSLLELSKLLMYEFFCKSLEPHWQNKVQLHKMDTDSFVLSFDTQMENSIEFLKQNKDEFDLSELDKSHEVYNPINKKGIGKMLNPITSIPWDKHTQQGDCPCLYV